MVKESSLNELSEENRMHEDNSKRQDTTSNKDLSDKNTERQGILTLNNLADNGDEKFELEKEYKGKEKNMDSDQEQPLERNTHKTTNHPMQDTLLHQSIQRTEQNEERNQDKGNHEEEEYLLTERGRSRARNSRKDIKDRYATSVKRKQKKDTSSPNIS
ncbi:uncharacterized protein [Nicotiana sylvestris]|uniref:uncharacterized protein n=1 Tax=Nicotiana sylvestris TaxID=4096 RepID=UPI00388CBA9B